MELEIKKLKGSFPPLITPFQNGEVDYDAYASLAQFQLEKGSQGILVNGTTSEPSTLTSSERNKIVDIAVETVGKKLPIVVATGSQSLAETQMLTSHAIKSGADALLIVTPYYIRPSQKGLIEYYLEVTRECEIPWMIYHIPGRAAVSVSFNTIRELKEKSTTFVGMKHAVNDLGFVSECINGFPDFLVFVGLEELSFPEMAIGAVGLMNAVGNVRPDLLADMCEAIWNNDLELGRNLHKKLFELNRAVFYDTNPIPIKYMMKRLGILASNEHRLPMVPASTDLEKKLDGVLSRAGLI